MPRPLGSDPRLPARVPPGARQRPEGQRAFPTTRPGTMEAALSARAASSHLCYTCSCCMRPMNTALRSANTYACKKATINSNSMIPTTKAAVRMPMPQFQTAR